MKCWGIESRPAAISAAPIFVFLSHGTTGHGRVLSPGGIYLRVTFDTAGLVGHIGLGTRKNFSKGLAGAMVLHLLLGLRR